MSWPLQWPAGKFDRYTRWSGRRSAFVRDEEDSTLVGAVCRMLVTGGPSVVGASARAVTAGGNFNDALAFSGTGVDRQAGFERLTRLQLFMLLEAKNHPASFHDLIDILAANAQTLALTEWGVGSQNFEESDEDFFVVNEEAGVGDTISFTAQRASGSGDLEVRFYRHKACAFADKDCSKSYQVYPPVGADGSSPETAPTSGDFTFTGSSGGDCPPGAPCGGTYWKLFAGVRMKPGGSCNSGYTLRVEFQKRAPGNKGVE